MGMPTNDAMRQETQASIVQWTEDTFGLISSNVRVAARANEEMAELLRALTTYENHPKAPEEAADVVIVLYRLASRLGVELVIQSNWNGADDSTSTAWNISIVELATLANEKMAGLLRYSAAIYYSAAREEIVELVRVLSFLVHRLGTDLATEINKKMAVNRSRVWKLDGTGHGYHVRTKTE